MKVTQVHTRILIGLFSPLITIEVHLGNGLPTFTLVGLPEISIKEAKDRVRCALINSNYIFPMKKITMNLAPADLPKEGTGFDLPLAIAILAASKQLICKEFESYVLVGELSLSGEIKKIRGAINIAIATINEGKKLIISSENAEELGILQERHAIFIAKHLIDVVEHLNNKRQLKHPQPMLIEDFSKSSSELDFNDVYGQQHAKRALEIAASGGHNLLLMGPPGTGKTMLAERFTTILPHLTYQEALECLSIQSLYEPLIDLKKYWYHRPFRSPHHSVTLAGLIGGGKLPSAGEITLAHNGVLFLDELPEFKKSILDSLRQPLEKGYIVLSRVNRKITLPASFQLIAAMNPSPTGHYQGLHNRTSSSQLLNYVNRLSAPFLERFDLSTEVNLEYKNSETMQIEQKYSESSSIIRQRVSHARNKQLKRQGKLNAKLNNKELQLYCAITTADQQFLDTTIKKLQLSQRRHHKIIKVARTIADLDNKADLQRNHIIEAISYRSIDNFILNLTQSCSS